MIKGVFLVGAGPGDEGLITVKGAQLLETADVIVYDNLVNQELLKKARPGCRMIYVGKKSSQHTMQQEDINELLVELSRTYDCVVRLKGGDPYVFGRGSEEGQVLYDAGVQFEVVPGISSAIGGLSYAGIPITARGVATSFHVITGHMSSLSDKPDFSSLAKLSGTLVFLMGVANLEEIVKELLNYGKSPSTPVAIICQATTPTQKVYVGELSTIDELAKREKIQPPSLIVVGEVVKYRNTLNFFEKRPLFGKKILVTRSKANQSKMSTELTNLGAQVVQMPTIHIQEMNRDRLTEAVLSIEKVDGIIFTSGVGVEIFFAVLKEQHLDVRHLGGKKIIAVGKETEKILEKQGIFADFLPDKYSKEGIADLLDDVGTKGEAYLLPQSARGDKEWISRLNKKYKITVIDCYDTLDIETITLNLEENTAFDYLTFTSASTVHGFMKQCAHYPEETLALMLEKAKVVAIGPSTKATLESYKIRVDLQPENYTIEEMIQCMVEDATDESKAGNRRID